MTRAEIVAAIRRAGRELGRAPSRGELKRITGVSHYRVLAEFRTLREAIRAAGLEPNRKGQRIGTEALIRDWQRVRKKLGRKPSRSEYVREGRYSAGALVARFGAWSAIGLTAKAASENGETIARNAKSAKQSKLKTGNHKGAAGTAVRLASGAEPRVFEGDKAIAMRWATSLTAIPGPLEGKKRVTEAIAAMVVRTLLGDSWPRAFGMELDGNQHSALSIQPNQGRELNHKGHEGAQSQSGRTWAQRELNHRSHEGWRNEEDASGPSLAVKAPLVQDDRLRRGEVAPRRLLKDRPVMGPPFDRRPLTNAPVNEMGVVFLFALVAADLGFQVESLWGRFPDGHAKREVALGRWQVCRIEFEYESKNFLLHGHDPKGCDVIVCWRHNWKDVPEGIEVIELCRLFGM